MKPWIVRIQRFIKKLNTTLSISLQVQVVARSDEGLRPNDQATRTPTQRGAVPGLWRVPGNAGLRQVTLTLALTNPNYPNPDPHNRERWQEVINSTPFKAAVADGRCNITTFFCTLNHILPTRWVRKPWAETRCRWLVYSDQGRYLYWLAEHLPQGTMSTHTPTSTPAPTLTLPTPTPPQVFNTPRKVADLEEELQTVMVAVMVGRWLVGSWSFKKRFHRRYVFPLVSYSVCSPTLYH